MGELLANILEFSATERDKAGLTRLTASERAHGWLIGLLSKAPLVAVPEGKSPLRELWFEFLLKEAASELKQQHRDAKILLGVPAEERAAALSAMCPMERAVALSAMSPEDRAAALVAILPEDRAAALAAMTPEAKAATLSTISQDAVPRISHTSATDPAQLLSEASQVDTPEQVSNAVRKDF